MAEFIGTLDKLIKKEKRSGRIVELTIEESARIDYVVAASLIPSKRIIIQARRKRELKN